MTAEEFVEGPAGDAVLTAEVGLNRLTACYTEKIIGASSSLEMVCGSRPAVHLSQYAALQSGELRLRAPYSQVISFRKQASLKRLKNMFHC